MHTMDGLTDSQTKVVTSFTAGLRQIGVDEDIALHQAFEILDKFDIEYPLIDHDCVCGLQRYGTAYHVAAEILYAAMDPEGMIGQGR